METKKGIRNRLLAITVVMLAMVIIPLLGEYIKNGGSIPKDFFLFPPTTVDPKAGFNLIVFIIISVAILAGVLLYIYPWIFGFKQPPKGAEEQKNGTARLPSWFWIGVLLFVPTAIVMWGKFSEPKILINFSVIPMFWGFSLMLDGVTYVRNRGCSIFSDMPRTLVGIGLASIFGWLIFEYLNFFVSDNWCYPKADLIGISSFYAYALIGSAGLMPMTIEVYSFLTTFKGLKNRYSYGPKIVLSKKGQYTALIISLLVSFAISFYPDELFFAIWFIPLIVLSLLMDIMGLWTPFRPIAEKGNWTPLALICMAQFIMGFLHESWNYLSAGHNPFKTFNPDYWIYSVPYVDVLHVFEMPLLGYFGYVPFGAYFWVWWLVVAFILNTPPYFGKNNSYA